MGNRFILLFLAVLFLLFSLEVYANEGLTEKTVTYDGMVLNGFLRDLSKFKLSISLKKYRSKIDSSTKNHLWGIEGNQPDNIIQEMVLNVNNRRIIFPTHSYNDLCNVVLPNGVYLMQNNSTIMMYVKGGDGAGAYTAVFELSSAKLIKRTIQFVNSDGDIDQISMRY